MSADLKVIYEGSAEYTGDIIVVGERASARIVVVDGVIKKITTPDNSETKDEKYLKEDVIGGGLVSQFIRFVWEDGFTKKEKKEEPKEEVIEEPVEEKKEATKKATSKKK